MRLITLFSLVFLYACLFVQPLWAMSGENTYVFAVSACPPWKTKLLEKYAKDIAYACRNDVELYTSSVKEALDIPPENIFTLIDEQATYEGLQKGLIEFADKVPKGSRVLMLFNFHGDLSDIDREDKPVKDEVLVLWTEDKPFTMLSALSLKQWISASELRGMIDKVKADEIIITIDACHSGGAVPDILKKHGRDKNWQGREALIMSSKSDQFSYFTLDGSHGLFTFNFSESIRSGSSNLKAAFEKADRDTIEYIELDFNQKKCSEMLWETLHKRKQCEQTPITYDPSNLLPTIKLNSTSPVDNK
ncbi:MAG: caspase family protein [Thermodesulfobacteriales bacterium]